MAHVAAKLAMPLSAALLGTLLACTGPSEREAVNGCSGAMAANLVIYRSTLIRGLTRSPFEWADRRWRVNAGSATSTGMEHSLQISPTGAIAKFEIRDTDKDNSPSDSVSKSDRVRRSELSGSLYGDPTRLPNGQPLWGAFSFRHHAWSDPAGMRELQGGIYGQIHIGSDFGGSPALAFRRTSGGLFRITTRGESDPAGSVQYEAPLSFGEAHDIVYRVTLHPTNGTLKVWLDGKKVTDVNDASIGHSNAESYWNLGVYFARGISGTVVAEYANHIYPSDKALVSRTSAAPCWPEQ